MGPGPGGPGEGPRQSVGSASRQSSFNGARSRRTRRGKIENLDITALYTLQWGPVPEDQERRSRPSSRCGQPSLQWGPVPEDQERSSGEAYSVQTVATLQWGPVPEDQERSRAAFTTRDACR